MVLLNKLNITSELEFMREEERLSKLSAKRLFESGFLNTLQAGTFESLRVIHRELFKEIYDFAGKIRDVNISKGHFRFAPIAYLKEAIKKIEAMKQSNFEEIVEKYIEMNIAHPFREGNGRSMRIWLDLMLKKEIGKVIEWSKIEKEEYMLAMERSPIKDVEIKVLLNSALTDEINNFSVFMRGVDASYAYEGYGFFEASKLS